MLQFPFWTRSRDPVAFFPLSPDYYIAVFSQDIYKTNHTHIHGKAAAVRTLVERKKTHSSGMKKEKGRKTEIKKLLAFSCLVECNQSRTSPVAVFVVCSYI